MPQLLHRLAGAIASWLIDKPKSVGAVLAAVVLLSAATLPTLKADSGTSSFIADGDPSRVFQRLVERQFIGEDMLFIGYETDDVFSSKALNDLRALDEDLKALMMPTADGGTLTLVEDVVSLTTIKDVDGADQTYRSVPLVPDQIPTDPVALERIRSRAMNNPMIRQGLLSKDNKGVAGIEVRLVEGLDDDAFASVTEQVRKRIGEGSARFYLAGDPVVTVDSAVYQERDLEKFIPISYALLLVAVWVYSRRLAAVGLALVNATLAVVFSMAMVALFGKLTNLSSIMPPLVMVLSVATIVHFTSEYAHQDKTLDRLEAARRTLHELLVPTFMCELTTAVGFISFALSPIPALREFGLAAAIAVMGVFGLSFLTLALAVRVFRSDQLLSPATSWVSVMVERAMSTMTDLSIRKPWRMLVGVGVATVVALVGVARLEVNHDDVEQFSAGLPVRVATEFMNERLGGSGEIVVSLKTDTENRFLDPAELRRIEALQKFLIDDLGATATFSFADYVKLMHRGFNGDSATAYRLPDTKEQVAQLVFLNGDDRLSQFIDSQNRWVRISARSTKTGSAGLTRDFERLDAYLKAHFPASEGYEARSSGSTYLSVVIGNNILGSQTSSFLLSLLLIFVPIAVMFGSLTAGAFTIPPNLFPIIATLGLMGWFNIALDVSTTMIASIILGIVVDDTTHFIQTIRACLSRGVPMETAIRKTMTTKGVGALWITLIITMGFVALVTSSFKPTASFGLLTAFGMVSGAFAEMCMLPPLLLVTKTRLGIKAPAPGSGPS